MNNYSTNLSSNIASVLFSKNTPFSVRLFRSSQGKNPFEILKLEMDSQFFVAQLTLGGSFYKTNILLKIYHQDDIEQGNLVKELLRLSQQENSPFPPILTFAPEDHKTKPSFSPLFYCSKKDVFFNAYCETCQSAMIYNEIEGAIECKYCMKLRENSRRFRVDNTEEVQELEALIYSFGKLQGPESEVPCITCENHASCFNNLDEEHIKPDVFKFIYPVSTRTFCFYAFEYTPLMLSEFSDLVGGMDNFLFVEHLKKQDNGGRLLFMEEAVHQLSARNEYNVFSSLNKKLRVFLGLCDIALKLEAEGIYADSYMKTENLRVAIQQSLTSIDDHNAYPVLLPVIQVSKENIFKEKSASLHIKETINAGNNKNTVVEVVMFDENGDPASIVLGDVIELQFDNKNVTCIVKQKNHQNIVLESLKVLEPVIEQEYLSYFSQEPSQIVKYVYIDDANTQSNYSNLSHLFFILLLSNSVIGEAEVDHALKILFSKTHNINKDEVNETFLNTIIHTTPALSVVFRQENTLYKPGINSCQLIPDLYWLKLLTLGLKLSGVNIINSKSILTHVSDEIEFLLSAINHDSTIEQVDKIDDAELIKSALAGIINDTQWLDGAISAVGVNNVNEENADKTNLMTKRKKLLSSDDETLIMPNKKPI